MVQDSLRTPSLHFMLKPDQRFPWLGTEALYGFLDCSRIALLSFFASFCIVFSRDK